VFNRVLIERREELDVLRVGDVAWLHKNGACFVVEGPEKEQARCDAFEISPSGPLPGPKMLRAQATVGEVEQEALRAVGLDYETFGKMPYGTHEGARRPLRVTVGAPCVEVDERGLRVSFELPRGAYATTVLRELLEDCPWFG
jgi:tRNA pseudouridine13 synthase